MEKQSFHSCDFFERFVFTYRNKTYFKCCKRFSKRKYRNNNLFQTNLDHNVASSIDGANALKLDENYEMKNLEDQNGLLIVLRVSRKV